MAKGTDVLSRGRYPQKSLANFVYSRPVLWPNSRPRELQHRHRERNSIERRGEGWGVRGGGRGCRGNEGKSGVKSTLARLRVYVTFKPLTVQVDFYLNEVSTGIDPSLSSPIVYIYNSDRTFFFSCATPYLHLPQAVQGYSLVVKIAGRHRLSLSERKRFSRTAPGPTL